MGAPATRWAIVGTGELAGNVVADLRSTENVELKAVMCESAEIGGKFAAVWDIPTIFTDLTDLLALPDLDVVYLVTPEPAHFPTAKAAILAGKHVLVEKPAALAADDARELADLARAAGVFLMEASWMRFLPAIRKALDLVAAGEIGTVRSVQASCGYPFPPDPESAMWRPELGGGSTFEQGIYTVTLPYLIFGSPSSIVARGALADSGVDSEASVLLGFPAGEQAVLSTSLTTFLPMTATICGTSGQIQLGEGFWHTDSLRLLRTDSTTEDFEFASQPNGYIPMLRAANEAILAGRTEHELNPISDTIAILEIAEEVIRQIKSNASQLAV